MPSEAPTFNRAHINKDMYIAVELFIPIQPTKKLYTEALGYLYLYTNQKR